MIDNDENAQNSQAEEQSNETTSATQQQHIDILRDTNANAGMEKKNLNLDSNDLEKN